MENSNVNDLWPIPEKPWRKKPIYHFNYIITKAFFLEYKFWISGYLKNVHSIYVSTQQGSVNLVILTS